jgi:hypothetical protein
MAFRVTRVSLRSLALYGLVVGTVNGALLGVPVAYAVMEVSRLFRPGDGTDAALVAYGVLLVVGVVGGLVSATLCGALYNRFGDGIRVAAVEED